ncbi:FAD-dependent monooxygenase [Streptomyces sp. NPDC088770]|uniref:FAD-dependent monooxygenase n=1 Tax=Streptomyces sp. NPDC088770 TaxID=3365895 RepID=UPI00382EAD28
MERTERGLLFCVPLDDTHHRVATFDFRKEREADGELTLEEFTDSLREIWGDDLGASRPWWLSWFTDSACRAEHYRAGRIFLAGDAAHTHFPVGGRGVNPGLQDACSTSAGSSPPTSTAGLPKGCSTPTTASARPPPARCWPTPVRRSS